MSRRRNQSGAALVVVLLILFVLTAVALTFFVASRLEVRTATSISNIVRVDLLSDAAIAIAIAHLNADFLQHPDATSNDHAWRTLFNGTWAAGKPWALRKQVPLQNGGVPEVDLNNPDPGRLAPNPFVEFPDGQIEPLYRGGRTKEWLFIPRHEPSGPVLYDESASIVGIADNQQPRWNPVDNPFVTASFYDYSSGQYPIEQIADITDVDNDGDGFRDAIWIPLPQDNHYPDDALDNNLNGLVDELQDDGLDNDGDGVADGANGEPDTDEAIEAGIFVYWGGEDRLDNDGDGFVDHNDTPGNAPPPYEYDPANPAAGYFLTAPLPGIEIPVDLNADGYVNELDFVPNPSEINEDGDPRMDPLRVVLPNSVTVNVGGGLFITLTEADVDVIDNDYDLIANDYYAYAYIGPNTFGSLAFPPYVLKGYDALGKPIVDDAGFNSYLEDPLSTSGFIPNYYDTWQLPGNWATAQRATGVVRDADLYAVPREKSYTEINLDAVFGPGNFTFTPANTPLVLNTPTALRAALRVSHSGEPACELVGRAAILITDEASKVNLNAAGGHTYNDDDVDLITSQQQGPLRRALGEGNSVFEYETRVLPAVGSDLSSKLWGLLTGSPDGTVLDVVPGEGSSLSANGGPYNWDLSFPGYGRVDDNGDALLLAMNNRDDDGDGIIDEGTNPNFPELLGAFEGIDEPGEMRRFNPFRNEDAELDAVDNDDDGVTDEIGEYGDRQLQNDNQVTETNGIKSEISEYLRNLTTAWSTDRGVNYFESNDGVRARNSIDFNYASPQQIASNLMIIGNFVPVTELRVERPDLPGVFARYFGADFASPTPAEIGLTLTARFFAMGLRQGDVHVSSPNRSVQGGLLHTRTNPGGNLYSATRSLFNHTIPADPQLQAMQVATDLVDNRDADHTRSYMVTENTPRGTVPNGRSPWPAPTDLNPREAITESDILALGEVQDHLENTLGVRNKIVESIDEWWGTPENFGGVEVTGDGGFPEERRISYATTGTEAIRINELMVRPVRRVEAEADPDSDDELLDPQFYDGTPVFHIASKTVADELSPPAVSGWQAVGNGVLGRSSYFKTTEPAFSYDGGVGGFEASVPDVIEFQFAEAENPLSAPQGLPAGRHYLTVNLSELDLPTVNDGDQISYTIKYVNTADADPNNDFSIVGDIRTFVQDAITGADQAILNDYFDTWWRDVPRAHVSAGNPGQADGWVFLDGTREDFTYPGSGPTGYFLDGGGLLNAPYEDTGAGIKLYSHTVTVPPFIDVNPADGTPDIVLSVAVRISPDAPVGQSLAVNFFDFSQEPDHEWVELANISNEVVDISGWQLEVGVPDVAGVTSDPFKSTWTVPASTLVAPGGMVLLAFNKFDTYLELPGSFFSSVVPTKINQNGMGMAKGPFANFGGPLIDDITVPPIADVTPLLPIGNVFYDPTGSVFDRFDDASTSQNEFIDYIDRDGDGVSSVLLTQGQTPQNQQRADTDATRTENSISTRPDPVTGNPNPAQPWDRIVEMINVRLEPDPSDGLYPLGGGRSMNDVLGVDDVARFVLRGGVLPNYPERDGIDNDGDGGYVREEIIGTDPGTGDSIFAYLYYPGTLDKDMVDNDLDGLIDERPVVEALLSPSFPNFLRSEGVDEGSMHLNEGYLWRSFGAGSYENDVLPVVFFNDRATYESGFLEGQPLFEPFGDQRAIDARRDFRADNALPVGSIYPVDKVLRLGDKTTDPFAAPNVRPFLYGDALYLGSDLDPPDWKTFVERRWNPGDCVIVTLYEGSARGGQVADRVTYREYDVTNRTIDDVVPYPPTMVGGTGLNTDYRTFWPPDQMGLDFYRSLERKHPSYNGDRFGTQNRWQATDGNYDDWSDSMSVFTGAVDVGSVNYFSVLGDSSPDARFSTSTGIRLYWHAFWASPLRMNLAQRISQNPPDVTSYEAATTDSPFPQFNSVAVYTDPFTGAIMANKDWTYEKINLPNIPFGKLSEVLSVPHLVFSHRMQNTAAQTTNIAARFLWDSTHVNYALKFGAGQQGWQDLAMQGAVLGQDNTTDEISASLAKVVMNSMAPADAIVLTVGQASMTPISPAPALATAAVLDWETDRSAPAAWAPVFLFPLSGGESYVYPPYPDGSVAAGFNSPGQHYLFNGDFLFRAGSPTNADTWGAGLTPAVLAGRWPLNQRAFVYVSERRPFQDNTTDAPQALFEWDINDGLENGEYIVYIGTTMPGLATRLRAADAVARQVQGIPLLDQENFGGAGNFAEDYLLSRNPSARLAIEVITDRTRAQGIAPVTGGPGLVPPEFWDAEVYEAGPDGYILYGGAAGGSWKPLVVRVNSNYLGLRVRNDGSAGQLGAITHVVLAPRKRTAGKININTVDSRVVRTNSASRQEYFNALLGLPGVINASATSPIPFFADVNIPSVNTNATPWAPPFDPDGAPADTFGKGAAVPPFSGGTTSTLAPYTPPTAFGQAEEEITGALQLSSMILSGRREHADGRYYTSITDLIDPVPFAHPLDPNPVYPLSTIDPTLPNLDPVTGASAYEVWAEETIGRFDEISNLITTRSDVFEITVTVQSGYGSDKDGDGWFNYRDDEEFITTAENKTRVVYERRSSADRTDEAVR